MKCLSALASIKCRIAILDELTAATTYANSFLGTIGTFRWRVSHIRQPAQEEGRLAAEIGITRISYRIWSMSPFGPLRHIAAPRSLTGHAELEAQRFIVEGDACDLARDAARAALR